MRRRLKCGYTLVEMLIVLAILATVVSLGWPSLRKLSEKGQLQDAARQLRIALARARLRAIETGTAQQFRYQPGTGRFEITAVTLGVAPDPLDATIGEADPDQATTEQFLPGGVRFLDADQAPGDLRVEDGGAADWAPPIVFYPNGRSSNARIRLISPNYFIDVSLRGLTGTVTLSPATRLERPDEPPLGQETFEGLR